MNSLNIFLFILEAATAAAAAAETNVGKEMSGDVINIHQDILTVVIMDKYESVTRSSIDSAFEGLASAEESIRLKYDFMFIEGMNKSKIVENGKIFC